MLNTRDGFWLWFTRRQSRRGWYLDYFTLFSNSKVDPFREVVIVYSDTDVLLMLLYHYQTFCTQTIVRVGRGDHKRDINIGESVEALGDAKSQALVGVVHSQTAKKLGNLMIMQNSRAATHLLHLFLRLSMLLYYLVILSNIQRKKVLIWWYNHICPESLLYKPSIRQPFKITVTYNLRKKQLESDKLPSTFSALKYMIYRSHYMTYIWKSAISTNPFLPDPENSGWKKIDNEYETFMLLWQVNILLLSSQWSNLVCVHARKQTVILYVVIARRKGWCVPNMMNMMSLNSNEKS